MIRFISQFTVNFIRNNEQILFQNHLRNLFQILLFHNRPRGVVGERKHKHLGFVRNGIPKLLCGETEFILSLQVNDDRNGIGQHSAGLVGYVAGLGNEHLIPRIDHGTQGNVNGLRTAYGNQHLIGIVVCKMKTAFQVIADFNLQFLQTCIGGVEGSSLFQGIDTLIPDVPGGIEVGFTNTEGNSIIHFAYDVKEFPDARRFDIDYFIGQRISHGVIFSLVSSFFFARMVPWSLYFFRIK